MDKIFMFLVILELGLARIYFLRLCSSWPNTVLMWTLVVEFSGSRLNRASRR